MVTPQDLNYSLQPGEWMIAYCYGAGNGGDSAFHFLRYDSEIGWTHKPSFRDEVTELDFAGNKIQSPAFADLGRYIKSTLLYFVIAEEK